MLLACTLLFGLSVPASAAFDAEDSENINHINTNVWKLTSAFVDSVASFTWDQNKDAQLTPAQYFAYALHGLKGSITSSGSFLSFYPNSALNSGVLSLGSDSKDYFYSNWRNLFSSLSSTDANYWTVHTMSDNAAPSWLYQLAHSTAQSGLTSELLMNWGNASYVAGNTAPGDSALSSQSWFGKMLTAVNSSKTNTSGLATEATSKLIQQTLLTNQSNDATYFGRIISELASQSTLSSFYDVFSEKYYLPTYSSQNPGEFSTGYYVNRSFSSGLINLLQGNNTGLIAINDNIRNLDNFLRTENDQKLLKTTDNKKTYVNDFVYSRDDSYYQSFEVGSMIQDTLSPDIYVGDATNALGELLSGTSNDDYWGWFSSATDSDLHPAASGVSTLSLDDELSSQDIADSETVWVINPYASSSDLVSDFFGGD